MTYEQRGERPESGGTFYGFDHLKFYVGNAVQVSSYYCTRLGFTPIAYRGLETGHRTSASHVVRQGRITFVFESSIRPVESEISNHCTVHGDGVKDVAFEVDDVKEVFNSAVKRGAKIVKDIWEESDEDGKVLMATIKTYGDVTHTFIQKVDYKGLFLPGYKRHYHSNDNILSFLPKVDLKSIDHVVGNQPAKEMDNVAQWYMKTLQFHRFWSIDDKQLHTEYSALNSVVVCNYERTVKLPINEPAKGLRRSQIDEYIEYNGGPGVQHIALYTNDIIKSVTAAKARGMLFLNTPDTYYDVLRENLKASPVNVEEDLAAVQKLKILIDHDDEGYLLQIFSKPVQDRPTLFIEFIQRHNHQGFGAGNFKSLFRSIELDQEARGNLTEIK